MEPVESGLGPFASPDDFVQEQGRRAQAKQEQVERLEQKRRVVSIKPRYLDRDAIEHHKFQMRVKAQEKRDRGKKPSG